MCVIVISVWCVHILWLISFVIVYLIRQDYIWVLICVIKFCWHEVWNCWIMLFDCEHWHFISKFLIVRCIKCRLAIDIDVKQHTSCFNAILHIPSIHRWKPIFLFHVYTSRNIFRWFKFWLIIQSWGIKRIYFNWRLFSAWSFKEWLRFFFKVTLTSLYP